MQRYSGTCRVMPVTAQAAPPATRLGTCGTRGMPVPQVWRLERLSALPARHSRAALPARRLRCLKPRGEPVEVILRERRRLCLRRRASPSTRARRALRRLHWCARALPPDPGLAGGQGCGATRACRFSPHPLPRAWGASAASRAFRPPPPLRGSGRLPRSP
jgi:hypothetical protein